MSANHEASDDMLCSLQSISTRHSPREIISQLEDIQRAQIVRQKSLDFFEHLECLYFSDSAKRWVGIDNVDNHKPRFMWRGTINAFMKSHYIALSYTWQASEQETDLSAGGYIIQRRGSNVLEPSPVRDCVFKRVEKYMAYTDTRYLWIDRYCVEQQEGRKKQEGIHAMDRVYSLSKHPVALLTRSINSIEDLRILGAVLRGQLMSRIWLSPETSSEDALRAIELLKEITSDKWFTRCWTFPESYRANIEMVLLIPHPPSLNKMEFPELGSLEEELCVSSTKLYKQATKLCLAYRSLHPLHAYLCNCILSRVEKYTISLQDPDASEEESAPKSMSPAIIANLAARELTNPWDRLDIAANCCQYSIRLNSQWLKREKHSLSLSMLALCLLNGEIMSNHPDANVDAAKAGASTISEFLKMQFFNKLQSPFPTGKLTFNKSCRFDEVKLTEEGVRTWGYLWKLGRSIPTQRISRGEHRYRGHIYYRNGDFRRRQYSPGPTNYRRLSEHSKLRRLRQLVNKLYYHQEYSLASRLRKLVGERRRTANRIRTFSQKWMFQMACKVAEADRGKTLRTARLFNGYQEGYAIFVDENAKRGTQSSSNNSVRSNTKRPAYVFTSDWAARYVSERVDLNDVDRHVSLVVDSDNLDGRGRPRLPRLFTKSWIHGLCFFSGCSQEEVVFPWPASLWEL